MRVQGERDKAFQLRILGYSYNEIRAKLGTPKSTLRTWFADIVLSDKANNRLKTRIREGSYKGLLKRSKMQTHLARQRAAKFREEGEKRISKLSSDDLLIIGTTLYWAEGYKRLQRRFGRELTAHAISFLNSDPEAIRIFVKFLTDILQVPAQKIRLCMRLYPHINETEAKRYWLKITDLSADCFRKSTFLVTGASKGKRPFNRLPYGTMQVYVNDTNKFHYLLGLINGLINGVKKDL